MIKNLSHFIALLFVVGSLFAPARTQTAEPSPSTGSQAAEVVKEDDRLPFMQSEPVAEQQQQDPSSGLFLAKSAGATLLVVGLIFFGAWGARKLGFGQKASRAPGDEIELSIITNISVASGRTLAAVRFGERILLVGSTPQSFTLLADNTGFGSEGASPRSVAEMLLEEEDSFLDEFKLARSRQERSETNGGQI